MMVPFRPLSGVQRRPPGLHLPAMLLLSMAGSAYAAVPPAPAPAPAAPDRSEVHLTIGEAPILEWLRAATPYTVTVGSPIVGADLVFQEPSELHLKEGAVSLKIRVKGRTIPLDQVISPVVAIVYDPNLNKYFGVLASLPIQLPGLGPIDLKDYIPRFEIPDVLEDLWRFPDRPVGLTLRIRRITVRERLLEVGADVAFDSGNPRGARSAR
jgi:hypothetical protein